MKRKIRTKVEVREIGGGTFTTRTRYETIRGVRTRVTQITGKVPPPIKIERVKVGRVVRKLEITEHPINVVRKIVYETTASPIKVMPPTKLEFPNACRLARVSRRSSRRGAHRENLYPLGSEGNHPVAHGRWPHRPDRSCTSRSTGKIRRR